MDVLIRNAEEKDLDALSALEDECFSLPWTREQLRGELPDERHEFLVAEEDGAVVGYIGMMCVLDEGYISNVAVSAPARRKGIGRMLVKEMLRRAETRELSFVTLEVREHNDGAIALYSGAGFAPVGKRKNYYERPREDAVLMTLFFNKEEKDHEDTCI
ncbi:MAG: ribosomal protein S18-alanine N-acetyltransferase [Oscillospiraceae bacterium]|nr:ribosomal protein S18-alanine N-acetyltransferase [Oscillospiraceae bacterium]